MVTTKREYIMRLLENIREKLEDGLTQEPLFEHEYHDEAVEILKREVLRDCR